MLFFNKEGLKLKNVFKKGGHCMELSNFMGENMRLLQQALPDMEQIRYCVKLSSVTNRREESGVTNKFASMMSGIGNLVSDTISSSIFNSYFIGTVQFHL